MEGRDHMFSYLGGLDKPRRALLYACFYAFFIRCRRPVKEPLQLAFSVILHMFRSIGIYQSFYFVDKSCDVSTMLLQEFGVTAVHLPVVLNDKIPKGIGADTIEPLRKGVLVASQVEGTGNHFVLSEYAHDGGYLWMHVS